MKRLYIKGRLTTFTHPDFNPDLIEFILPDAILKMGDIESKSLPTDAPTTRTKHAYTEQKVIDMSYGQVVAVIRDGKIETLNLLSNPFA